MNNRTSYRGLVGKIYSRLGKKKKTIADTLLNNPEEILRTSANELARKCRCDQATVVRFAQQLGYDGYTAMKLAVATESNSVWRDYESGADDQSDLGAISGKLMQLHTETLKGTLANVKEGSFNEIINKISSSKKVMICGSGASRLAAEDLNVKLMRQGINTICFADPQMWKVFLGYTDKNDTLILFSHSGETPEIVEFAELAREKGRFLVVISGFEGSRLARLADHLLLTECCGENSIRLGAMASRSAQSIIIDLITVCLSLRDKDHSWNLIERSYEFTK